MAIPMIPKISQLVLHPSTPICWFTNGISSPLNMIPRPLPIDMMPAALPRCAGGNQGVTRITIGTLANPLADPVRQ